MKKKKYIFVSVIITSIFLASCGQNKSGFSFPPTPVSAVKVIEKKVSYYNEYPASVVALNQVELRPEVSGYITGVFFNDGQHVTKGMKLYSIDQQQYKAAYDIAKANLNKAQQDYKRYEELAKSNAIAAQTLEHAYEDLRAAESNLSAVETNLRYSTIYAPFDGTIGISQVKLGSAVTVGQTLLNTISSDNPMAVDFSVNENEIERYTEMLNKKTNPKDSTFTIILPDQTIYPYSGHLILLDRAVDPQTATITARLVFPNTKNLLRPGLTCNVRVLNNNSEKSILIPYKAVTEQMGEYFVFVVNGKKVSQRKVELGRTINDMVIVNNGLTPGEEVVTEGVQKLRDNSPILFIPEKAKTKEAAAYSK